jgi:cytochrome c peroxidase
MRKLVTAGLFGIMSLQASLSLAADLPRAVTAADFPDPVIDRVLLGRDLFFDPILSGNRNIACATCHHPRHGSADGVSLSLGEGAVGLGPDRHLPDGARVTSRIPRNAPALWNLGAYEFTTMFHDGRTMADTAAPYGITMPPGFALERALPSPLAAQMILPMLSSEEMAGQAGENPVATAVADGRIPGEDGAWAMIAARVAAIPAYAARFEATRAGNALHIADIAEALAAFIAFEFRATDSPFDRYLAGDDTALNPAAARGLALFYGDAGCAGCHAGPFQTDHGFHAIGMPQLGPGKEAGGADRGRHYVTGDPADLYRFRTPSLRNVALTAPYGHAGAYATLEAALRHHLDPVAGLMGYDATQAVLVPAPGLTPDWAVMNDPAQRIEIAAAIELAPQPLSEDQIADLLAFLHALTDPVAAAGRLGIPQTVPSGLAVDR